MLLTPNSLVVSHFVDGHLGFPNKKSNQEGFRVMRREGEGERARHVPAEHPHKDRVPAAQPGWQTGPPAGRVTRG